jgi:lysophospholipase L1-like esterase
VIVAIVAFAYARWLPWEATNMLNRTRCTRRLAVVVGVLLASGVFVAPQTFGQTTPPGSKWAASWHATPGGPYPVGIPGPQPDLKFAFPAPQIGAVDQSFRMIVKPDLWGRRIRLRFANTVGSQPVRLDGAFVGLQASGGTLVPGTNQPVTFTGGQNGITIAPGASAFSDPIELDFVKDPAAADLAGRKLAVSFHVAGSSGPMTWHGKAMTTSYLSAPRSGIRGSDENDDAFPFTANSWFFLDGVDVMAPAETLVIAAFGSSITDGSLATLNGDDRWPDFLSRRLHALYGTRVSLVNAGMSANEILKPAVGGASGLERLEREIFCIAGLNVILGTDGLNDLAISNAPAEAVIAAIEQVVKKVRERGGIKIIATTLTPTLGAGGPIFSVYGTPEFDARRRAVNQFLRTAGIFDGIADFEAAVIDAGSGALRAEFQPNSTVGGPGDKVHPNRAGYQAMAKAVDLALVAPPAAGSAPRAPLSAPEHCPR